jgi:glycerol-3-phosphate cytidylyltransferase
MRVDKKAKTGYTAGCFDMFHTGHLNVLRRAKSRCDRLVVGVNSDAAMYKYKKRYPIMPEKDRKEIVESIKYVDEVILVDNTDKVYAYETIKFDKIFVGDDHRGEPDWVKLEEYLKLHDSVVEYFMYTKHVSSTKLRIALENLLETYS